MSEFSGQTIIVGSGLAGLLAALCLAPRPCVLLTAGSLGGDSSSGWAQGGIAAAVGDDDSIEMHCADTLAAGDGLCDADSVRRIVSAGPAVIARLQALGVRFDLRPDGRLAVGLEAAHSRRRIVHAMGDATGSEIVRALVAQVRATPSIAVLDHARLLRIDADSAVRAVWVRRDGRDIRIPTGSVVLATGGIGALFRDTTNPGSAIGSGLAAAARAGAALGDLEFVQFHPTALVTPNGDTTLPLISEAVRGEGATLIDETGARFMDNELAPRDVVARAVWRHLQVGHQVFLDARTALGQRFGARFPGIDAACRMRGLDPATMPLPVRPAAHYHMGGVLVDAAGRSSVPGLHAIGEVACTGLHGANRLASNSLLEAACTAIAVADSIAGVEATTSHQRTTDDLPAANISDHLAAVRDIMTASAGVLRERAPLEAAIARLAPLAETCDAALAGLLVCRQALDRTESRGAHFRTDHPVPGGTIGTRSAITHIGNAP